MTRSNVRSARKAHAAARTRRFEEWRRRPGSDTWHFVRSCSLWPTGVGMDVRHSKPTSGELCDQCRAKERRSDG